MPPFNGKSTDCVVTILLATLEYELSRQCYRLTKKSGGGGQLTKYACEREVMTISCPPKHVIRIIRANYGRFSLHVCNDDGINWSNTQCMDPASTEVMISRCDSRPYCVVTASDYTFRDRCFDTVKYLETTYECVDQSEPVDLSSEEIHTTAQADDVAKVDATPTTSQPQVDKEQQTVAIHPTKKTWTWPFLTTDIAKSVDVETPPLLEQGQIFFVHDNNDDYCPMAEERGVKLPRTKAGTLLHLPCPNNAYEHVEVQCGLDAQWQLAQLDISHCLSSWIKDMLSADLFASNASVAEAIANLRSIPGRHRDLYGGDITEVSSFVKRLIKVSTQVYAQQSYQEQRRSYANLSKVVTETFSFLLSPQNLKAWKHMPFDQQRYAAQLLMSSVEESALMLSASMLPAADTHTVWSPQIVLEVSTVPMQNHLQYPTSSLYRQTDDTVRLPASSIVASDQRWFKLVYISYNGLGELLRPIDSNGESVRRRVASNVVTLVVPKESRLSDLAEPILLSFHSPKSLGGKNAHCVFWDSNALGASGISGEWSKEGCSLAGQNETHVTCSCNHLTSFAVLMDIHGIEFSSSDKLALTFISYFGCVVSVICLAATLATFSLFKFLQCERTTIHKNLCLCLLVAELVYMFGIWQTTDRVTCGIVAVLLHYFFLAAFAWMLLEGFQLYSLLVEVFESGHNRRTCFYCFGYGAPFVVVSVSLIIGWSSYGTEQYCWLNTENYFVFSFVGPVIVVLAANFVLLFISMAIIARHVPYSRAPQNPDKSAFLNRIKFWIKGAFILVVLLGLTWSLGILLVSQSAVAIAYMFTILNSLQGLFIFCFQVLMNKKVRDGWKMWFVRSLFPREWSNQQYRGCYASAECNGGKLCREACSKQQAYNAHLQNAYCHNGDALCSTKTSSGTIPDSFSAAPCFLATEKLGKREYALYLPRNGVRKSLRLYGAGFSRPPPSVPPPQPPSDYSLTQVPMEYGHTSICPLDSVRCQRHQSCFGEESPTVYERVNQDFYSTCGASDCLACSSSVEALLYRGATNGGVRDVGTQSSTYGWQYVMPLEAEAARCGNLVPSSCALSNGQISASKGDVVVCRSCTDSSYEVPNSSPERCACTCRARTLI
ncbi:latrophilin Cirl [Trichuris trichiura]|uniref:Latrophilin Cirl n=1 Tax=Trichuris trichiura TaxID=36087 RepID=A0A077ZFL1_TRITR|nr:latrophilin Cirl [Trichuris trichiura]